MTVNVANGLDKAPWLSPITNRSDAADAYERLGQALATAGFSALSDYAYAAAAEIDLSDPEVQKSWGGPFNGQQGRCDLFACLISTLNPAAIIETGTYRGTTTEWIADNFTGPILTCEMQRRYFLQAERKLGRFPNVTVYQGDSRKFLAEVLPNLDQAGTWLFYLDAHWYDDLPLTEEIEIILRSTKNAVIMIDDFMVPSDPGYKYDDYGPGKVLSLRLLKEFRHRDLNFFFPRLQSSEETGARRGSCVLATSTVERVGEIGLLRPADESDWSTLEQGESVEAQLLEHRVELERRNEMIRVRDAEIEKLTRLLREGEAEVEKLARLLREEQGAVQRISDELLTVKAYMGQHQPC
jgi:predicted O-methyltransferase YrrM